MSSLVIALDGPEGVGKSTQIHLLAEALTAKGITVYVTRNAGGTPIGEALRTAMLSDTPRPPATDIYISLAMSAALAEDLQHHNEQVIIIDRSPLSMVAYNGYGSNFANLALVHEACRDILVSYGLDTLFYLDAPQEILDGRRKQRGVTDYFEKQDADFHQRVREGYQKALADLEQNGPHNLAVVKIDAAQSVNEVHQNLLQAVLDKAPSL